MSASAPALLHTPARSAEPESAPLAPAPKKHRLTDTGFKVLLSQCLQELLLEEPSMGDAGLAAGILKAANQFASAAVPPKLAADLDDAKRWLKAIHTVNSRSCSR